MIGSEKFFADKLCPHFPPVLDPFSPEQGATKPASCVGSKCSQWQWVVGPADVDNRRQEQTGHCGLTGRTY